MGLTITQKILADHCQRKQVEVGEFIMAKADGVMTSDSSSAMVIEDFNKMGVEKVFDSEKIFIVFDHNVPAKDVTSANNAAAIRKFIRKHNLKYFYEIGRGGIQHLVAAEEGLVLPGDLYVGADSHTCTLGALGAFAAGVGRSNIVSLWALGEVWLKVPESIRVILWGKKGDWIVGKDIALDLLNRIGLEGAIYCSIEFTGETLSQLSMSDRFSLCNLSVEAGAKNGIVPPDKITIEWLKKYKSKRVYKLYQSDPNACYRATYEIDISKLSPRVAKPNLPSNVVGVEELSDTPIDQAFIGSCTNGSIEDLRMAARVLAGKRINRNVRLIISPGTQKIYFEALNEGLLKIFLEANSIIGPPTCGPCAGLHMGVLGKFKRAISSTNRNFIGRMGDPESEVYLANPAVVAASAIAGKIIHPKEVI